MSSTNSQHEPDSDADENDDENTWIPPLMIEDDDEIEESSMNWLA